MILIYNLELNKKTEVSFDVVLSRTQDYMKQKFSKTLSFSDNEKNQEMIKNHIEQFIVSNNIFVPNMSLNKCINKIYDEMIEYSILTPLLKRNDIDEININAWNDIEVDYSDGRYEKHPEHFRSPQHAIDIIRKLLQVKDKTIDETNNIVVSYLKNNIRITAIYKNICGESSGIVCSIRIVNPKNLTTSDIINGGTCTKNMHNFLTQLFIYGISQCFFGATGSGKTTLMADIMRNYPDNKRLITIEKSAREFNLTKKDKNGRILNRVVNLVTHDSHSSIRKVTILDLLTASLTMNPDAICIAEMKNEEAWEAQEAARTGQTVLTTTHANSCAQVYDRLTTLCIQKYTEIPYNIIKHLNAQAFPISVGLKKFSENNKRKRIVTEISECIYDEKSDTHIIKPLWKYDLISKQFIKTAIISKELQEQLLNNGMPNYILDNLLNMEEV